MRGSPPARPLTVLESTWAMTLAKSITLGPKRSINLPIKGVRPANTSMAAAETSDKVALSQPNSSRIGLKKTPIPVAQIKKDIIQVIATRYQP